MNRFFGTMVVVGLSAAALAVPMGYSETREATQAPPTTAAQKGEATPMMVSLNEMKWLELPERKGMQYAVLSGDPKTGPYTQMRKVPAGTDNPLHAHSSEIKNVIISGVWYTGADAASAKDFGPGSVVIMPGDWVHVSGCRPGSDCVLYQEGKGKFDFKPVEPTKTEMKP